MNEKYDNFKVRLRSREDGTFIVFVDYYKNGVLIDQKRTTNIKFIQRIIDTATSTIKDAELSENNLEANYQKQGTIIIENYEKIKKSNILSSFASKVDKKLKKVKKQDKKEILAGVKNLKVTKNKSIFKKIALKTSKFIPITTLAIVAMTQLAPIINNLQDFNLYSSKQVIANDYVASNLSDNRVYAKMLRSDNQDILVPVIESENQNINENNNELSESVSTSVPVEETVVPQAVETTTSVEEVVTPKVVETPAPVQEIVTPDVVETPAPVEEIVTPDVVETPAPVEEVVTPDVVETPAPVQEIVTPDVVETPAPVEEVVTPEVVETPAPVQEIVTPEVIETPAPVEEIVTPDVVETPAPVEEIVTPDVVETPAPVEEVVTPEVVRTPAPVQEIVTPDVVETPVPVEEIVTPEVIETPAPVEESMPSEAIVPVNDSLLIDDNVETVSDNNSNLSSYGLENSSGIFKSNSYADKLTPEEKAKFAAIIAGEDSYSYEGSLAAASTVLNRCDTANFASYGGDDPYKQLTAPSQFVAKNSALAQTYLNHPEQIPDFVMAAVDDALNGYRNHNYLSFRASSGNDRTQIGSNGNWYFNQSSEVPNYGYVENNKSK